MEFTKQQIEANQKRRARFQKLFKDSPSKTKQEFKDSADINKIMKRFLAGEAFPQATREGYYADVPNIKNLHEAYELVQQSEESFMSLPAEARKRFENDPLQLVSFLQDPANVDEAVKLGLMEAPRTAPIEAPKVPVEQEVQKASQQVNVT